MAEFDQGRGKRNAGSAPIQPPKEKIIPLKEDYVPTEADAPIVHQAYEKKQRELDAQLSLNQTQGKQKGFSKSSLDDVLAAQTED